MRNEEDAFELTSIYKTNGLDMKEITIHQLSIFAAVYAINAKKWLFEHDFVIKHERSVFQVSRFREN